MKKSRIQQGSLMGILKNTSSKAVAKPMPVPVDRKGMSSLNALVAVLCPDGVEYKSLGEIATVVRGASPRPIQKYITDNADGVNWIKIGDVSSENKYITHTKERIIPEGVKHSRYVKEGDFILSNSMSFGRPYIMKTSGCIHDGWLSISNFEETYISDFLYYILSSSCIQRQSLLSG